MLLQQKNMSDSFSNLLTEKPRRFRLARKLHPGVIAQKILMQENCAINLIVIPA